MSKREKEKEREIEREYEREKEKKGREKHDKKRRERHQETQPAKGSRAALSWQTSQHRVGLLQRRNRLSADQKAVEECSQCGGAQGPALHRPDCSTNCEWSSGPLSWGEKKKKKQDGGKWADSKRRQEGTGFLAARRSVGHRGCTGK